MHDIEVEAELKLLSAKSIAMVSDKIFYDNRNAVYLGMCSIMATNHVWLLSTWNVDSGTEKWNVNFVFNLLHLNINSHMCLLYWTVRYKTIGLKQIGGQDY